MCLMCAHVCTGVCAHACNTLVCIFMCHVSTYIVHMCSCVMHVHYMYLYKHAPMYLYAYVCTFVHMPDCVYRCLCMHMCLCTHVYMCLCMYICIHMCTRICVHAPAHRCMHYTCMCAHMRMHTLSARACVYVCRHACMCVLVHACVWGGPQPITPFLLPILSHLQKMQSLGGPSGAWPLYSDTPGDRHCDCTSVSDREF
jgi:hypothetical protein